MRRYSSWSISPGAKRSSRMRRVYGLAGRTRREPGRAWSREGEGRGEDNDDGGGPEREDGEVGGLPPLEPVEGGAAGEEPGGQPGGTGEVDEQDEVEPERSDAVRGEVEVPNPGDHGCEHHRVEGE